MECVETKKNLQPRILFPARLLFKIQGGIESFSDKKKNTVKLIKCYNEVQEYKGV